MNTRTVEVPVSGLTVADVASLLGVRRDWVREHGAELGGVKLGDGRSCPWRFHSSAIANWMVARQLATIETRFAS